MSSADAIGEPLVCPCAARCVLVAAIRGPDHFIRAETPGPLRRGDRRPDAFGSIDGECWTSALSVQFCRRPARGGQHQSWWCRQVFGRRHAREPERWGTSDRSAGSGDVGTFVCLFLHTNDTTGSAISEQEKHHFVDLMMVPFEHSRYIDAVRSQAASLSFAASSSAKVGKSRQEWARLGKSRQE